MRHLSQTVLRCDGYPCAATRKHPGGARRGSAPPGYRLPDEGSPVLSLLLLLPGLSLDLLLLVQHRAFLGDLDVVHRYVDLRHPQAGQALDPVDDVAARRLGELRDRVAVLDDHREVYGRLLVAYLDADAAGVVSGRAAGNALQEAADGCGGAAGHLHLLHLLGRDTGDLGDDRVANGGPAALALEGASLAVPLGSLFAHGLSSPRRLRPHSYAKPGALKPRTPEVEEPKSSVTGADLFAVPLLEQELSGDVASEGGYVTFCGEPAFRPYREEIVE